MSAYAQGAVSGTGSHRPYIALILTFLLVISTFSILSCKVEGETPDDHVDMEDLMSQYPSKVIKEGDEYHILDDISLPATKPLYIGPGTTVLFDEDVTLNLSAPARLEGTGPDRIHLGPIDPQLGWGGLFLLERDPSLNTHISNVTFIGAEKALWSDKGDMLVENVKMINCSRSGIEIRGPLGTGNKVEIRGIEILDAHFYGIHLLKVEDVHLEDLYINSSGTSIRAVESNIVLHSSSIQESNSYGIYIKDSMLIAEDVELASTMGSNINQIFSFNSTTFIDGSDLSGSSTAVYLFSGSEMDIDGSSITDCFIDGIKSEASRLTANELLIQGCERNGVESYDSVVELNRVQFMGNGPGSGDLSYSTIYSRSSNFTIDGGVLTGSGYSHIEGLSSHFILQGTTLGTSGSDELTLDQGSSVELIDIITPSDINIIDQGSFVKGSISFKVLVRNYTSGDGIEGATVDVQDFDGEWILSASTGQDGFTGLEVIPISLINSEGAFTYLPMNVVVQKEGYEVSTASLEDPLNELQVDLYPPNDPPQLTLIGPVNGTTAEETILIEGRITDDLNVHMLRYRFDGSPYRTIEELDVDTGGGFSIEIDMGGLSPKNHELYVHAFDGSHLSEASMRTIYVISTGSNDSDGDGIPNIDEDLDGDGIVDPDETDPNDPDTDDDGLSDGLEIDDSDGFTTDPLNPDSDDDFLRDGDEDHNGNGRVDEGETDPNNGDTDGDGIIDSEDIYPLDSDRIDDARSNNDSLLVLALAVILLILIVIAIYLFYIRSKDAAPQEKEEPADRNTYRRRRPAAEPRKDEEGRSRRRNGL